MNRKAIVLWFISICKLFSLISKLIHALEGSKRGSFGLQKVPF